MQGIAASKALISSRDHTCVLLDGCTVQCWGLGTSGQLGTENVSESFGPVLSLGADLTAVAASQSHTCSLLVSGELQCWGQFGDGSTAVLGTAISLGRTVRAVAAGGDHTCAIVEVNGQGALKCWGRGKFGQLGYNSKDNKGDASFEMESLGYVYLGSGRSAVGITAGYAHTCAVLEIGRAHV